MKLIRDSGKPHWAIGLHVTCKFCESVFVAETMNDLSKIAYDAETVNMSCPSCKAYQRVSKPVKAQPQLRSMPVSSPSTRWQPSSNPPELDWDEVRLLSEQFTDAQEDAINRTMRTMPAAPVIRGVKATGPVEGVEPVEFPNGPLGGSTHVKSYVRDREY